MNKVTVSLTSIVLLDLKSWLPRRKRIRRKKESCLRITILKLTQILSDGYHGVRDLHGREEDATKIKITLVSNW